MQGQLKGFHEVTNHIVGQRACRLIGQVLQVPEVARGQPQIRTRRRRVKGSARQLHYQAGTLLFGFGEALLQGQVTVLSPPCFLLRL